MSTKILRKTFLEVSQGYTPFFFDKKALYIKHLSHGDHVELEDIQDRFEKKARDSGLPTEAEQLEFIKKEKLWDPREDKKLNDKKEYVAGLERGKRNVKLPSMLARIDEDIIKEGAEIRELEDKKRSLIGLTVESYSNKLINDYYVIKSIYTGTDFKSLYLPQEEYDEIADDELTSLFVVYSRALETCTESNLKKLTMQDFYRSYYYLCEDDFCQFFGRPIVDFTYFQIKLANYSRHYTDILRRVKIETVPENIRDDPDKLASYVESIEKGKKMVDQGGGKAATGLVGASKEDVKALTGQEFTKAPTKPMNMQELMKVMKR